MGGLHDSLADYVQDEIMERLLPLKTEERRRSLLPVMEHFQIFTAAQVLLRLAQEKNRIAVLLEPLRHCLIDYIDQTNHPQHRGGINRETVGLIVEAHIAADDGNFKMFAGILHPLDR